MSQRPTSHGILKRYYPIVRTLESYLQSVLRLDGPDKDTLHHSDDADAYRQLLENSFVALSSIGEDVRFTVTCPMADMREVIDRSQEKLFKQKRASNNVITLGYRSRNNASTGHDMKRLGIVNSSVNTIVTDLQSLEWETVLQRIGVDAMIHLLTETTIFVSLPNDCLCQMTGLPIIYQSTLSCLKRSAEGQRISKKRKRDGDSHEGANAHKENKRGAPSIATPNDVQFQRRRLFFAKPLYSSHPSKGLVIGLPPRHILNTLNPHGSISPKVDGQFPDPEPKKQAENSRCLAKYVFPRCFSLMSPFTSMRKNHMYSSYADRTDEVRKIGSMKTPRRLKHVLSLMDKMLHRHGKCGYRALRDLACPSKVKAARTSDVNSSVILEMLSEETSHVHLKSQASANFSSGDITCSPHGLTQALNHAKQKPKFLEFSCSYTEVYRYAALVTKAVIPKAFWGNEQNLKATLKYVKQFVTCRKYENLSVHNVLQGLSLSACDWLIPPSSNSSRVAVSDTHKRRELLEDFIFWYFNEFLLPLIRTTFYVTDSTAYRNKVLYFRHDDWEFLCGPLVERLTNTTFEKLTEEEAKQILSQRKLGFSSVRLMPKETGVRPIVNLKRKIAGSTWPVPKERSINEILETAFKVLSYEKDKHIERMGASVFSPGDIYAKLKTFKSSLPKSSDGRLPNLYFVKVDVQACFDTVDQGKLLEILRTVISEDSYLIQRFGCITDTSVGERRRRPPHDMHAFPEDEQPDFIQWARNFAMILRHSIFVDKVNYRREEKNDLLELLEQHITENIVKIGNEYYRQIVGIPQGSILSSILCSFCYGDMEQSFKEVLASQPNVMLRLIDDYLLITTSLNTAIKYLNMMNKGHPEYGCYIAKDKTKTNFDYGDNILNVLGPEVQEFPWCGYTINMKSLSVSRDYSRYRGADMQDTLTIERSRSVGKSFRNKMLLLAKSCSYVIYTDPILNSTEDVYTNVYQNFLVTAMKMHEYLRNISTRIFKNERFVIDTIHQVVAFCWSAIRNRSINARAWNRSIERLAVYWLGYHAFHSIFSLKPQNFSSLLSKLDAELGRPKYRTVRHRLKHLTQKAMSEILSHITF